MQLCLHPLETPWAGHSSFAIGCFAMSSESTTCTEAKWQRSESVCMHSSPSCLTMFRVMIDGEFTVYSIAWQLFI